MGKILFIHELAAITIISTYQILIAMKKMKTLITLLLTILVISVLFYSCNVETSGIPGSTGKTSEILVVIDKNEWDSKIGATIRAFFGQEQEMLNQPEPKYTLPNITPATLDDSKMFRSHRNLFIVDIKKDVEKPIIEIEKNFWSKPQMVIKITAPSEAVWLEEFEKRKKTFLMLFDKVEKLRITEAFRKIENVSIRKKLMKDYKMSMVIPKEFYIAVEKPNFLWIRKEAQSFSQGLIIYFYNYTDTIAFNYDRIIEVRDSLTKKYIPGSIDNSYMRTAKIIKPQSTPMNFGGNYAVETRGLWETEGDFMGGPFISLTTVDEKRNRVVTVEGYVYFPNNKKRDKLKQMESILLTLKFMD